MKRSKISKDTKDAIRYLKSIGKKPYIIFFLGAVLGIAYFVSFYGIKILNPTFTDWLQLPTSDLKQHYMGWVFFRQESWNFPLGAIHTLAYPYGISTTYTDSIPLLAIIFKLFSPILPSNFQYFGIWGVLCFALQGGIAASIFRKWTKNIFIILLCATFFIVSPILMARMFIHTALASQWILLAAIWAMLEHKRLSGTKSQVIIWSLILALAAVIHPYFIPMVFFPFIVSLCLTHRQWLRTILKLIIPIIIMILIFWIIGGFAVNTSNATSDGLGDYGLNLNSLYNPLGWSSLMSSIPNLSPSGETLAYVGAGILLLIPIIFYLAWNRYASLSQLRSVFKKVKKRHIGILLAAVGLIMMAISPRIQFGTHILMNIQIPTRIARYWAIFRASARLFWIFYYLLFIGVLRGIIYAMRRKATLTVIIFLFIFTCIQVGDIRFSSAAKNDRAHFKMVDNSAFKYVSPLSLVGWQESVVNKKHLIYLEGMDTHTYYELVDIASENHLTMNTGYFARSPQTQIQQFQQEQKKLLLEHHANIATNLYITQDKEFTEQLRRNGYHLRRIDGYTIITP